MKYNGLRGNGLIVLRSGDPNVNFVEHDDRGEADGFAALEMARQPGVYIVYQPVAIIRPKLAADVEIQELKPSTSRKLRSGS